MKDKKWVSEKIYALCMEKANSVMLAETKAGRKGGKYGSAKISDITCWIHLTDAVESGTISPMEAYDTIKLGYVAEHLTVRESRYSHLL
jgi:hypothetical protein